jgi:hypothetical protein
MLATELWRCPQCLYWAACNENYFGGLLPCIWLDAYVPQIDDYGEELDHA